MRNQIEIQLTHDCGAEFVEQMPYYNSRARSDTVSFEKRRIIIEAERKHRCTEYDVFMNLQHSLYNQLVKVLLIHYCQAGSQAGITDITVSEVKGTKTTVLFSRTFNADNQPFCALASPIAFDLDALKGLLGEDDDAYRLRIVVMHWLHHGKFGDRQRQLESLWRTFERLCEYHLHQPLDVRFIVATGLSDMVTELMTHANSYPHSAAVVAAETTDTLRVLHWQEMIRNNYPENSPQPKLRSYKASLIDPFLDERVVQLMFDVLAYRRSELQRYGLFNTIEADLYTKLATHQRRNMDVVALLIHYIYFLRNRLFHGQLLLRVSVFDDTNADNMRLDFLTALLSTLVVELINNRQAL